MGDSSLGMQRPKTCHLESFARAFCVRITSMPFVQMRHVLQRVLLRPLMTASTGRTPINAITGLLPTFFLS